MRLVLSSLPPKPTRIRALYRRDFGTYNQYSFPPICSRPELVSDVISDLVVADVDLDIRVKFGDYRSNRS